MVIVHCRQLSLLLTIPELELELDEWIRGHRPIMVPALAFMQYLRKENTTLNEKKLPKTYFDRVGNLE